MNSSRGICGRCAVLRKSLFQCIFHQWIELFFNQNLTSPTDEVQILVEEEIQSVFNSDDYVEIIVKNNSRDFVNRMEIYKKVAKWS